MCCQSYIKAKLKERLVMRVKCSKCGHAFNVECKATREYKYYITDRKQVMIISTFIKNQHDGVIPISYIRKEIGNSFDVIEIINQIKSSFNDFIITASLNEIAHWINDALTLSYNRNTNGQNIEIVKINEKITFRVINTRLAEVTITQNG